MPAAAIRLGFVRQLICPLETRCMYAPVTFTLIIVAEARARSQVNTVKVLAVEFYRVQWTFPVHIDT